MMGQNPLIGALRDSLEALLAIGGYLLAALLFTLALLFWLGLAAILIVGGYHLGRLLNIW